ncbi:hypothetical protein KI387_025481, partial [Taxus chinensis]
MRPIYRRPDPAYYWASPKVEAEPILGEPYFYRGGVPQDWGYGKYEGAPYWYRQRPAEDGFHYYGPKYRDQGPRFYEPDGRDFGGDIGSHFRPVYDYPSPVAASGPFSFRPFHPGDQFRHPDEYPMRFVPVTYGSSGPWETEQAKQQCCGCPNHVCHPETRSVKAVERKGVMDGGSEEDLKAKPYSKKELAGPVMWFNPYEWWNRGCENKDRIEEKGNEYPVYRIPGNWSINDGYKEKEGQFPGYWISFDPNYRPHGGDEGDNKFPGYWIPLDLKHTPQGQGEDEKISPLEGKEERNRFPGYWIPMDSTRLQGQDGDKKNYSIEEKPQPFPVFWIPQGDWKAVNPQEGTKKDVLEIEDKKNNEADNRPVIVQQAGKGDDKQRPVQEVRKEDEKQRPVECIKETKVRDIPVKQLEEGKSAQAQKREEKVASNHKVSSPRASKLPPVCLRVDPLPGKKKSNGKSSSRSPSPPRKEENTKDNETSKSTEIPTFNASVEKTNAPKVSGEISKAERNSNVAGETEKIANENASLKASNFISEVKIAEDLKASEVNGESKKVEDDLKTQEARVKKTELSRDQAALKIQAFYRGWRVRKMQPLSKLREIAKIKKRVEELKRQVTRSDFVVELRRDNKTKGIMNETLMALLLQLDTIQ